MKRKIENKLIIKFFLVGVLVSAVLTSAEAGLFDSLNKLSNKATSIVNEAASTVSETASTVRREVAHVEQIKPSDVKYDGNVHIMSRVYGSIAIKPNDLKPGDFTRNNIGSLVATPQLEEKYRIERERIAKEEAAKREAERIAREKRMAEERAERERIAKEEAAKREAERIAREKRMAEYQSMKNTLTKSYLLDQQMARSRLVESMYPTEFAKLKAELEILMRNVEELKGRDLENDFIAVKKLQEQRSVIETEYMKLVALRLEKLQADIAKYTALRLNDENRFVTNINVVLDIKLGEEFTDVCKKLHPYKIKEVSISPTNAANSTLRKYAVDLQGQKDKEGISSVVLIFGGFSNKGAKLLVGADLKYTNGNSMSKIIESANKKFQPNLTSTVQRDIIGYDKDSLPSEWSKFQYAYYIKSKLRYEAHNESSMLQRTTIALQRVIEKYNPRSIVTSTVTFRGLGCVINIKSKDGSEMGESCVIRDETAISAMN